MSNFLPYLLKSTICITLLYLMFRTVMRKESFFALNRIVLLSIVVSSAVIPLLYLPGAVQSPVQVELLPVFAPVEAQTEAIPAASQENPTFVEQSVAQESIPDKADQNRTFSKQQLLQYLYLAGFLFTLLLLLQGLLALFSLFRRAKSVQMDGYRLLVIEKEIAAFSFGRYVILSQKDYEEHRQTLLAHEQAHIRLHHFFDLLLLETVRIFHWFNPVIYWLIKDLKEIHEFQADDYTLTNGIDATQYQLLIIQKGVGSQRFALANSFNHCQIKKRITMMNKSKINKAWSWKVATFLPLLALLLMAFGKRGENVSVKNNVPLQSISPPEIVLQSQKYPHSLPIEIKKDGNYIDSKLCSIQEVVKRAQEWQKTPRRDILLLIDDQISYSRIDEVREALLFKGVYNVNQSAHNFNEIIYPDGDVTESPKFTQGKWADWIHNQTKHFPDGKPKGWKYTIFFSFIIDKNGKVSDAHVIKGCDSPEIKAEFEQILTKIPNWKPAKKGNRDVSVICRRSVGWNPITVTATTEKK